MNDKQTVEEAALESIGRMSPKSYLGGKYIDQFIKGAQWQSSQQGWIDTDYSLPENRTWVLTYTKSDEIEMAHYKHGVFYRDDTLSVIYNVTHWMPLPNPPTPTNKDTLKENKI
jgi:hypothetical protein